MVLVGKIVLGNTEEEMRGSTSVSIFQGIKLILKIQKKKRHFCLNDLKIKPAI